MSWSLRPTRTTKITAILGKKTGIQTISGGNGIVVSTVMIMGTVLNAILGGTMRTTTSITKILYKTTVSPRSIRARRNCVLHAHALPTMIRIAPSPALSLTLKNQVTQRLLRTQACLETLLILQMDIITQLTITILAIPYHCRRRLTCRCFCSTIWCFSPYFSYTLGEL